MLKEIIKIKFLKVLPYWLIFLTVAVLAQEAVVLFSENSGKKSAGDGQIQAAPQVLGESVSIRGGLLAQPPKTFERIGQPDTSNVSAKSFLVYDLISGQELLFKNPDDKLGIASLTKLLTALVAYNQADLNRTFSITAKDTINVRPILGLQPNDAVKALDVFNAMLIGSCNDAALALSKYTAAQTGKKFVDLMNQQARDLGMNSSHFSNPLGFDSQYNYSTARDLKILISAAEQLAAFTNLGRRTTYEFSGSLGRLYQTKATNALLSAHPEIEAIKTGFTESSGGAMASAITFSGHRIVIVVLDSQDREGDTLKLIQLVKENFN